MVDMDVITPTGEYSTRRRIARDCNAKLHIQFHANSGGGHYALTEVTETGANAVCEQVAGKLAADFAAIFEENNSGVRTLSQGERGWVCIGDEVPGIIIEPFFCDDLRAVRIGKSLNGIEQTAQAIARRITETYPANSVICLTLGHYGKPSNPSDRGASVVGGGTEVDIMRPIFERTVALLRGGTVFDYFIKTVNCYSASQAKQYVEYLRAIPMYCRARRFGKTVIFHASGLKLGWAKGRAQSRLWGAEKRVIPWDDNMKFATPRDSYKAIIGPDVD